MSRTVPEQNSQLMSKYSPLDETIDKTMMKSLMEPMMVSNDKTINTNDTRADQGGHVYQVNSYNIH